MTAATEPFDVADYLSTPEDMAAYLAASIEESEGRVEFIARALGDIARAWGMTELARATGLGRESLYKALSENGNPQLGTVLSVVSALGLELTVRPARSEADAR